MASTQDEIDSIKMTSLDLSHDLTPGQILITVGADGEAIRHMIVDKQTHLENGKLISTNYVLTYVRNGLNWSELAAFRREALQRHGWMLPAGSD